VRGRGGRVSPACALVVLLLRLVHVIATLTAIGHIAAPTGLRRSSLRRQQPQPRRERQRRRGRTSRTCTGRRVLPDRQLRPGRRAGTGRAARAAHERVAGVAPRGRGCLTAVRRPWRLPWRGRALYRTSGRRGHLLALVVVVIAAEIKRSAADHVRAARRVRLLGRRANQHRKGGKNAVKSRHRNNTHRRVWRLRVSHARAAAGRQSSGGGGGVRARGGAAGSRRAVRSSHRTVLQ
jgi:hypothetical protein